MTNLGPLGNHKLSVKDADETAKGNVENDDKVSKSEAMVDLYPKNADVMVESNADGDKKTLRSTGNGRSK